MITTVAQGYVSQQLTITTTPIALNPNQIKIFAGPLKVPADENSYQQIALELQNSIGFPSSSPSDTIVSVASSDPTVGQIDSEITIPAGQTYAIATLNTTYKAGSTTITAVATNLLRGQQVITTTGFTPSKLAVYCVPSTLPSDRNTYQSIMVQLQDSQGHPAKDPQADVNLNLFSSQPTVGTVSSTLTIPFGQTQATGSISVNNSAGSTVITAQASSYTTGQATQTTCIIDFLPVQITATANSTSINNGQRTDIVVFITADDAAVTGATMHFTSDNGGSFTSTLEVGSGYYKTTFTALSFTKATTCTITATAVKTGYVTSQATTQVTVQPPPTTTPTPTSATNPTTTQSPKTNTSTTRSATTNNTGNVQIRIEDYDGNPLSNATVSSTTQPTGTNMLAGKTNSTGYVTFTNITVGQYSFNISKDGFESMNTGINYKGQTLKTTFALSSEIKASTSSISLTLPIVVAVVIVIIVVVIGIILLKRRSSRANQPFSSTNFKLSQYSN
jgi:hypothetical protein